jgi:hypothetical protein
MFGFWTPAPQSRFTAVNEFYVFNNALQKVEAQKEYLLSKANNPNVGDFRGYCREKGRILEKLLASVNDIISEFNQVQPAIKPQDELQRNQTVLQNLKGAIDSVTADEHKLLSTERHLWGHISPYIKTSAACQIPLAAGALIPTTWPGIGAGTIVGGIVSMVSTSIFLPLTHMAQRTTEEITREGSGYNARSGTLFASLKSSLEGIEFIQDSNLSKDAKSGPKI